MQPRRGWIFRSSTSAHCSSWPTSRPSTANPRWPERHVGRTAPLSGPELHGEARLQELAVTLAGVHLQSEGGAHATLDGARILSTRCTSPARTPTCTLQGSLSLQDTRQLDLAASGSINLKLAETLDPDLTAERHHHLPGGSARAPRRIPGLRGRIDFENGSLSLEDLPNGLSQLHGTLEFNQNRLEVTSLTAMSGGGLLSVGG